MDKEGLLLAIQESIQDTDRTNLGILLDDYLRDETTNEASRTLSVMLYNKYTTFKAEATAALMETIIRKDPALALVQGAENFLFRVAVLRGSMELYECFMEEAMEDFLAEKDEDEHAEFLFSLSDTAEKLSEVFFDKYVKAIKGMDFNGAFGNYENNENVLLINHEDYELMDEVVEKYNTIIGRRDIIKDLQSRLTA